MERMQIPEFKSEVEEIKWFVKNEPLLKSQRKTKLKFTDGHSFGMLSFRINKSGEVVKSEDDLDEVEKDANTMTVRCVINATNILDSHRDVHFPGIWKRSLSHKPQLYLVQEHKLSFEGIITDEVTAYTKSMTFKELGYPYSGETECLIFDCVLHKDRNPYMFEQYEKKRVKNHSVRMMPVKEYFCFNSDEPDAAQWKDNWTKYAPQVANQDDLKFVKWFYAVLEAKIVDEGSAVVKGSCFTTPTLEITDEKEKGPDSSTLDNTDPPEGTPTKSAWELFMQKGKTNNLN